MISRRFALPTLLALALLPLPALPQAQPARYEVEVLIFRNGELSAHLPAPATPDASVQGEPVAPKRLLDAATRLRAARDFSVLAHGAWTQAPAGWNSRRGVAIDQAGLTANGLSGTVILERGQYLHLGFNLRFQDGGREVVLDEVRRVKVNERNYFDHAGLGIIAIVTPASRSAD
jgi:hypothetical protein